MKLLILTCLVALAIARPMVEKISESEEHVTEIPEKHLRRRENIPVKNEQYLELNRYALPQSEMMNLYYEPFYWFEKMNNLKMTNLLKDKRMAIQKYVVSDDMLPPLQQKLLPIYKSKDLPLLRQQILPVQNLRMLRLSHKQRTLPEREMLPISETEHLAVNEKENIPVHQRELLLDLQREMPIVRKRDILLAPERVVLSERERESLRNNEREALLPVHKREILPLSQRENVLFLLRDAIEPREILPVQREVMPEAENLDVYPFPQPVANFYYPTEVNEVNSFIICR
ncbi:beta-casein [Sminthopsis crassicaudata]|uniref:beta-casein n=1 Tax=Sminthopsis crassicaudata TaxID=9301 RepID=UPI003D69A50E